MPIVAGDIRATMTLDASKFSDGVAQAQSGLSTLEAGGTRVSNAYASVESRLGQSAAAIAASMQQAGTSSQKLLDLAGRAEYANEKVYTLSARVDEAHAALEAAQAAAKQSADALTLLEESAAASADNLQWAREQLDALGKSSTATSGQISLARDEVAAFEAEVADLNKQVDAQRAVNTKNQSSVKRASDRYSSLSLQLSNAELAADRANGRFDALTQTLGGSGKGLSLAGLIDDISALGSSTLTGASRSLGTIAVNAAGIGSTTAAGAIAAEGLGDALAGLVSAINPTSLLLGGVAAAAGYGLYEFYQYASGAKDAAAAIAELNETANEWSETDVTTSYEQSEGMAAFGLGEEDFSSVVEPARGWMDELLRVWRDGKAETQEIVQEMTGGFTAGTDEMRDRLASLKATAASGGFVGDGFLAGLDTDVERLDEIDKEVEAILKKRQNGMLSDKDIEALQSLYDEREAISIKYNLEPEGAGFDQVIQSAEAALSRGGDPAQVWADTYSAATQGAAAYTDALNAEYDAQYAALQLLDDTVAGTDGLTERQRALAELTAWYNEQAAQGTREYYDTLAQVLDLTGEGMFGDGGEYTETAGRLERINALMDELSQTTDTTTRNKLTTELANELKELDETQIVELTSALTSMQAAAEQSGVELDETYAGVLEDIQAIKQSLNVNEDTFGADLLESLQNMFGENLDNEVLQVYGALNFDSLESSYKAWAEGEHADIIPTIDTSTIETDISGIEIDGLTGTVSIVTGNGQTYTIQDITIDPVTGRVGIVTADGQTLDIQDLTLSPETGHVEAVTADGRTLTIQDMTINPETGHIEAVTADGKTLTIQDISLDPLEGKVTVVTADGESLTVDIAALNDLEGTVVQIVEGENATKPTIQLNGEITDITYSTKTGSALSYDYNQGMAQLNDGEGEKVLWFIPRTSDVESLLNYTAAYERYQQAKAAASNTDGMEPNEIETLSAQLYSAETTLYDAAANMTNFLDVGDGFATLAESVADGLQMLANGEMDAAQAQELFDILNVLYTITTITDPKAASDLHYFTKQLAQAFGELDDTNFEGTTAETLGGKLGTALGNLAPQFEAAGVSISQGVGEGMKDTSAVEDAGQGIGDAAFTATAESVQMGSPARRLYPVGQSVTQGVGEGMKDVSAITTAAAIVANSASAALLAAAGDAAAGGQAIGDAAADGIDDVTSDFSAAGNNAGSSFVSELRRHIRSAASAATAIGSAAYNALRASLSIHSPSRKMRELGAYTGEGYALGISDRITMAESSIRRLAGASIQAASGATNNAYHNAVNINLNGATIRSDDDIRQLSRQLGRYITDANFAMT